MATRSTSVVKTGSAKNNYAMGKPGVIVPNPSGNPAGQVGPPKSSPSGIVVRRK